MNDGSEIYAESSQAPRCSQKTDDRTTSTSSMIICGGLTKAHEAYANEAQIYPEVFAGKTVPCH